MAPAPHGPHGGLVESPLEREGFAYDNYTDDDVVSLLEENARLRKLVITLRNSS